MRKQAVIETQQGQRVAALGDLAAQRLHVPVDHRRQLPGADDGVDEFGGRDDFVLLGRRIAWSRQTVRIEVNSGGWFLQACRLPQIGLEILDSIEAVEEHLDAIAAGVGVEE